MPFQMQGYKTENNLCRVSSILTIMEGVAKYNVNRTKLPADYLILSRNWPLQTTMLSRLSPDILTQECPSRMHIK